MAQTKNNRLQRVLIAVVIGAALGAAVGMLVKGRLPAAGEPDLQRNADAVPEVDSSAIEDSVAWQYARAYQEGDWGTVMTRTLWIQDRLDLVRETGGTEAVEAEKDALIATLGTRTIADNRLQDTGVDDQYIFTPGSSLTFDEVDDGREDLARPVARRTWLVVTYPAREKALLDRDGIPIRAIRVGLNVSHDGFVLKANIVGNLDIDWASIRYDWPSS